MTIDGKHLTVKDDNEEIDLRGLDVEYGLKRLEMEAGANPCISLKTCIRAYLVPFQCT